MALGVLGLLIAMIATTTYLRSSLLDRFQLQVIPQVQREPIEVFLLQTTTPPTTNLFLGQSPLRAMEAAKNVSSLLELYSLSSTSYRNNVIDRLTSHLMSCEKSWRNMSETTLPKAVVNINVAVQSELQALTNSTRSGLASYDFSASIRSRDPLKPLLDHVARKLHVFIVGCHKSLSTVQSLISIPTNQLQDIIRELNSCGSSYNDLQEEYNTKYSAYARQLQSYQSSTTESNKPSEYSSTDDWAQALEATGQHLKSRRARLDLTQSTLLYQYTKVKEFQNVLKKYQRVVRSRQTWMDKIHQSEILNTRETQEARTFRDSLLGGVNLQYKPKIDVSSVQTMKKLVRLVEAGPSKEIDLHTDAEDDTEEIEFVVIDQGRALLRSCIWYLHLIFEQDFMQLAISTGSKRKRTGDEKFWRPV